MNEKGLRIILRKLAVVVMGSFAWLSSFFSLAPTLGGDAVALPSVRTGIIRKGGTQWA